MKGIGRVLCIAILATSAAVAVAAEFRAYPGAQRDQKLEQLVNADPRNQGTESELYLTADPFDKVYEFYKVIGTEDVKMKKIPMRPLPGGGTVKWAFFTFDGADSITTSKYWAKIQRPTIFDADFKDIRDITSIQVARKK